MKMNVCNEFDATSCSVCDAVRMGTRVRWGACELRAGYACTG